MGFSWLFFFLLPPIILSPKGVALSSSDLIQETCKSSKYYELCISSLNSDSSSPKAMETRDLALIMARVGMTNATATTSYIASQWSKSNDVGMRRAMRECADMYASAGKALQTAAQDLGAEAYDYAYLHVMAAADYPNACRNGFRRPPLFYPPEIGAREEGFKRICDVLLGIIDAIIASN